MRFLVLICAALTAIVGVNCFPKTATGATNGLLQELKEFSDLTFTPEIQDLIDQYMEKDEEFQSFVKYASSEKFGELIAEIQSIPEFQDLFNYIVNAGFVQRFATTFAGQRERNITGGMAGFYKDLAALLPLEKLRDLYYTKLETSETFAAFVHKLQSPETQRLVDKMMEIEELQRLIIKAKSLGVDFEPFKKVMYQLFGIKFPTISLRTSAGLQQELDEFIELIFSPEYEDLIEQYAEKDEEYQSFVKYTSSDAFKTLIFDIIDIPEFQDLMNYIENASFLRKFARTFAGQPERNITGGMAGFYKDAAALLPLEKLRDLYYTKLETSETFAAFVHKLQSPETQRLVDKIMEIKELQRLIRKAKSLGVDFEPLKKVMYQLFGIKIPTISLRTSVGLRQELEEFFELTFTPEIGDLIEQYAEKDEEFQSFMKYTSSEEFGQLIADIRRIPEFQDLLNYIENAGFVQRFARTFAGQRERNITGGMAGFYKDVAALLPLEKLRDLYHDKLETSETFAAFVHKLQSPETQRLVDKMMEIKELQRLIRQAKSLGIDFEPFKKVMYQLFGIKFPTISF